MVELLTKIEPNFLLGLANLAIGFGGGYFTASITINVKKVKQVQNVKSGNAFQAGGDITICKK